jgi:hypothetical protein
MKIFLILIVNIPLFMAMVYGAGAGSGIDDASL